MKTINFGTIIKTTAATAFEAFSLIMDEVTRVGGDRSIEGPYSVGLMNGQIVTAVGYEARRLVARRLVAPKL